MQLKFVYYSLLTFLDEIHFDAFTHFSFSIKKYFCIYFWNQSLLKFRDIRIFFYLNYLKEAFSIFDVEKKCSIFDLEKVSKIGRDRRIKHLEATRFQRSFESKKQESLKDWSLFSRFKFFFKDIFFPIYLLFNAIHIQI